MHDHCEGQPFLVHLRAEHARLDAEIRRVEQALRNQHGTAGLSRAGQSLESLYNELAHHFQEEEQGGCVEEAASHCTSLAQQATSIERQHATLLTQLQHLVDRARKGTAELDQSFHDAFQQFARALRTHEAAEDRLLQEAFGYGCEDELGESKGES